MRHVTAWKVKKLETAEHQQQAGPVKSARLLFALNRGVLGEIEALGLELLELRQIRSRQKSQQGGWASVASLTVDLHRHVIPDFYWRASN